MSNLISDVSVSDGRVENVLKHLGVVAAFREREGHRGQAVKQDPKAPPDRAILDYLRVVVVVISTVDRADFVKTLTKI